MFDRLYRMAILGLLQLSIVLGIVLLPVAYLSRGVGVRLPIGRLVATLTEAYERAT